MTGRRGGWSLVETTVGMMVGTVALVALASVMISNSYLHSLALSRMELTSVAETRLDQLRSHAALQTTDTLKLQSGGSLDTNEANHFAVDTVFTTLGRSKRTYIVRWKVDPGPSGTRDVTVRVAPTEPRRNEAPFVNVRTLMLIR